MIASFGEYIRQLRNQKGFTLTQLAAQLNLDSANLSKIENGKRDFDEKRLKQLSEILSVDFDLLKSEYYSDLIARKIYDSKCTSHTLVLAEKKVEYLKNKNSKQGKLKF